MTEDKLVKLKIIFEEKLALLTKEKNIQIDDIGDDYDKASALTLESIEKSICDRNKIRERVIRRALKRIDDGTFGVCEECGEDISDNRLLVLPETSTCIVCADKLEKLSKQFN